MIVIMLCHLPTLSLFWLSLCAGGVSVIVLNVIFLKVAAPLEAAAGGGGRFAWSGMNIFIALFAPPPPLPSQMKFQMLKWKLKPYILQLQGSIYTVGLSVRFCVFALKHRQVDSWGSFTCAILECVFVWHFWSLLTDLCNFVRYQESISPTNLRNMQRRQHKINRI